MFYARQVVQSFFLAVYILQARTHVDVFARVTVFARKRQGGGPKVKSKNTLRSKLFNDNDRYVIYGAYGVLTVARCSCIQLPTRCNCARRPFLKHYAFHDHSEDSDDITEAAKLTVAAVRNMFLHASRN